MDQITKTVNQFLAFIVGIGLICFFSFVFLLASAQLNDSLLGDLLARLAGETARTARTESFAYWGRVGGEVATGLGFGQPLSSGGIGVVVTPVVIVATNPPANTTPAPTATATPTNYVRSSPYSEAGLLLWRGIDTSNGQPLPFGVSLKNVQDQARFALAQNSGDLLAAWLLNRIKGCEPLYNQMVQADYRDPTQADTIIAAASTLIAQCNPRVYEAYARQRWAKLSAWAPSDALPDEERAAEVLGGMKLIIGNKLDGPARQTRPEDTIEVTVQGYPEFVLDSRTLRLTAGTLTSLLAGAEWELGSGPYTVPGELFPASAAEPALPTEADLTPPVVSATPAAQPQGVAGGAEARPGTYVVQAGDTLYSIARKFNIRPADLIQANQATVGFNPDFITVGMQLVIPPATPTP